MSSLREAVDELDVQAWLEEYTTVKSTRSAEIILETCPECGRDDYKLYVNTNTKVFICHGCGFGTGVRDISVLLAQVADKTVHAIHQELLNTVVPAPDGDLLSKLNDIFTAKLATVGVVGEQEVVELPGIDSFDGITAGEVLSYAVGRGLRPDDFVNYKLRPAWKLNSFSGPFLVFPILYQDTPVGWQGRRVPAIEPKYVSCGSIARWLWPLHGTYYDRLVMHQHVVLVEGVFDAIAMWRIGINALCTFGKKISDNQVRLLKEMGVKSVSLAWDADAIKEIADAALKLQTAFTVSVVDFSVRPDHLADVKKVDAGDALKVPALEAWVIDRVTHAIKTDTSAFFNWRLDKSLNK